MAVEPPLIIRWTATAIADLDRFASFLEALGDKRLASAIARSIQAKTEMIAEHAKIGRPLAGSEAYRELAFAALKGRYILRYRLTEVDVTILRVFHSREKRD